MVCRNGAVFKSSGLGRKDSSGLTYEFPTEADNVLSVNVDSDMSSVPLRPASMKRERKKKLKAQDYEKVTKEEIRLCK